MNLKPEVITSRSNTLIKWVASLQNKKERNEEKCFIAEGIKLTKEALECKLTVTHIFVSEGKSAAVLTELSGLLSSVFYSSTQVVIVSDSVFEKISTEKAPQGVISVIKYLDFFNNADIIYKEEFFLSKDEKAIFLCSVRDPSNLGAIIRSAVAFGFDRIILSSDCADVYNPKTIRSAMGGIFKVYITVVASVERFIEAARFNGRRVLAAELNSEALTLDEVELTKNDIVIIGNEGHGIPEDISSLCDDSIFIPISDKTESLNASVAASIIMWEQRKG